MRGSLISHCAAVSLVGAAALALTACSSCASSPPGGGAAADAGPSDSPQSNVDASSDSASDTDSGSVPPDAAGGWSSLPGGSCELEYAAGAALTAADALSFVSCGTGCVAAGLAQGGLNAVLSQTVGAVVDGQLVLSISREANSGDVTHLTTLYARDGHGLAALRSRAPWARCRPMPLGATVPGYLDGASGTFSVAWLDLPASALQPGAAWFSAPSTGTTAAGWSSGFILPDGTGVGGASSRSAVAVRHFADAASQVFDMASIGSLVLYYARTARQMYVFDPSSLASQTLWSGGDIVDVMGLSPDKFVWLTGHGPNQGSFVYASADVTWSPLPRKAADLKASAAISVNVNSAAVGLKTFGDYAAIARCLAGSTTSCGLIVVRLSDGHQWTIRDPAGTSTLGLLAVTDSEIVVVRQNQGTYRNWIDSIVFLRLDALDSLAAL